MGKGKGWIIAAQGTPPNLVIQVRPWATRRGARNKMTERGRGKRKGRGGYQVRVGSRAEGRGRR